MSDLKESQADGVLTLEFDEALYPKDAIYGAAYIFIDRCYVRLDRPAADRISVRMKLKPEVDRDLSDLAGEFENELLSQSWRRLIVDENRRLIEQVSTQALSGAAGPPGLDDLLSMDIDDETAFEDPLGIAMSWEEKYKKKNPAKDAADAGKEPAKGAAAAEKEADKASTESKESE